MLYHERMVSGMCHWWCGMTIRDDEDDWCDDSDNAARWLEYWTHYRFSDSNRNIMNGDDCKMKVTVLSSSVWRELGGTKSVGKSVFKWWVSGGKTSSELGAGARGGPRPGTEAAEAGEVRLAGPRQQRTAARSSGESSGEQEPWAG